MLCRLTVVLLCCAVVGCVEFTFETCTSEEVQITAMTKRPTSEIACGCIGYETQFQPCNFTFRCDPALRHCHDCVTAPRATQGATVQNPVVKILLWNSWFDDIGLYRQELVLNCPIACEYFTNQHLLVEADGVIFSIIYATHFPPVRYADQIYIAHCMESEDSYFGKQLRDAAFMSKFDMKVTYKKARPSHPHTDEAFYRDHDSLWMNYAPIALWKNAHSEGSLPIVQPSQYAAGVAPVVWVSSNCNVARRMNYVKELMKYIDVDSYGSCLHNRDFPSEGSGRHDMSGPERKTELLASYRFTLAFENTWTRDYVTEKFFQPLLAGSVPVVMGAPNVEEYAPGPNSFIDVKDFGSPQALAQYLHSLLADEESYMAYHSWRGKPWQQSFSDMLHATYHSTPCRVCMEVARRREGM